MIIGLMATIVIPRFSSKSALPLNKVVQKLGGLIAYGKLQARRDGKLHRIFFSLTGSPFIQLEVQSSVNVSGQPVFTPVSTQKITPKIPLTGIDIKSLVVAHKDVMATHAEVETQTAWIFIAPSGIIQPATMVMADVKNRQEQKFEIEPFKSRITVVE